MQLSDIPNKLDRLFVYGTLVPDGVNHHMLEHLCGEWTPASIFGVVIEKGWGADHGCPGLILDKTSEQAKRVNGYVFSSQDLAAYWQALDEFEGEEYKRVVAHVSLDSGEQVEAYVYIIKAP